MPCSSSTLDVLDQRGIEIKSEFANEHSNPDVIKDSSPNNQITV